MINSKDISVVVQGAVSKTETLNCLKSIKKYLPNAEIILSTWEGSDISNLEGLYDVVVLNKDPGAGYYYKHGNNVKYNNLNRQLVSTQNGLKKATNIYAMKIRSDIILTSDSFLRYYDFYPKRDENYVLFKHKILTSTVVTRFAFDDYIEGSRINKINLPFHVSDWWFFGLKEDLEQYFDVPLIKEPAFSDYYKLEENKDKFNPYIYLEESYAQYAAEQYIAIECFKIHKNINIEHSGDISDAIIEQSRRYLINNFIFLEYCESGIYFNKYLVSKYHWLSPAYVDLYNKYRQDYEYQKYCDSEFKINKLTTYTIENKEYKKNRCQLLMHFQRVLGRKIKCNILKEVFITFFWLLLFIIKHFDFIILYLLYHNQTNSKANARKVLYDNTK